MEAKSSRVQRWSEHVCGNHCLELWKRQNPNVRTEMELWKAEDYKNNTYNDVRQELLHFVTDVLAHNSFKLQKRYRFLW